MGVHNQAGGILLGGTPLGGIPLGGTPLGGIPLGGIPLGGGSRHCAPGTGQLVSPSLHFR
ncbi:MAG TPA: hypothetical protein DIW53_27150 [Achromobacter sp.]|nr:hypothetical protein [Achromobacter sp.]